MTERFDRQSTPGETPELVPGSAADSAGTDRVAKFSLIAQAVSFVLFAALSALFNLRHELSAASFLVYAVFGFGFLATVSALFASLILRRARWLLVPVLAVAICFLQAWLLLVCCMRWGS